MDQSLKKKTEKKTTSLPGAEIQSDLASFFVGHFNPNDSALIKETTWNTQQNYPGSSFGISVKVHFLHPSFLDGFNHI